MKSDRYDVIVLGAGVSGLVSSFDLAQRGYGVCLLENYPDPGGNHISKSISGFTFDIGAIFFWDNNPLFEMFPKIRDVCVPVDYTIQRVNPDGIVTRYPYSIRDEFLTMSAMEMGRSIADLLYAKYKYRHHRSAEDYINYYLGSFLARKSGIDRYVERFYGIPSSRISHEFAHKRMNWIGSNAGLRERLKRAASPRSRQQGTPAASCIARPRSGFGDMYHLAVETLTDMGVASAFDAGIDRIRRCNGHYVVETRTGTLHCDRVLSTFPLQITGSLLGFETASAPVSTKMLTLFCSFDGNRKFDTTILYNFHAKGSWKRLTMHSDYYGRSEGREYFSVEITCIGPVPEEGAAFADFVESVRSVGLFSGTIHRLGSVVTDFAYPVYQIGSELGRDRYMSRIRSAGIDLVGRQGLFDYIPASDIAARNALAATGQTYEDKSPVLTEMSAAGGRLPQ
ncbi:NAD(P)-binding protein [Methylobacterium dankookense]|uniref:Amine oxidase domain-containing protein n=1 Tax=Methylobacterium dankookense TaxID=560405 RepID=A0A564FY56_9HYPH|nr:NAD(P)-binding protein [Methylobacterium dankookense]GJD57414.1 hypothetical protein IFDJLNFL_3315 [Methylobacterium dankookense]VUF12630.1 hypothetical protein MTDSW087_02323 [Methylobacterium dankookense]